MTPQQRKEATRYLAAFDFSGLFTDPAILDFIINYDIKYRMGQGAGEEEDA